MTDTRPCAYCHGDGIDPEAPPERFPKACYCCGGSGERPVLRPQQVSPLPRPTLDPRD